MKNQLNVYKASCKRGIRDNRIFAKFMATSLICGASLSSLEAASKLSDVVNNATISGFAFTRVTSLYGQDGSGTRWQWRFRPVITTGAVNGWSGSIGIFYSKGSSAPDDNNTDGDISASRGDVVVNSTDRFGISDYYITYKSKETLGSDTTIVAGQKSPGTVLNDNVLDRAMGVFISNKDISALNIGFQWWDTWIGDDIYFAPRNAGSDVANINRSIGNNVFLFSLSSGADFTKDTGLRYNLTYAYGNRWFSYMVFGDVSYTAKFNDQSLELLLQLSARGLVNNPQILSNNVGFGNVYQQLGTAANETNQSKFAKNSGVYNLRLNYKLSVDEDGKSVGFIGLSVGTMGSFGRGYGTLIDNTGGFKVGGVIWNSYSGPEANGFGILGVGAFDGSWLYGGYLKGEMKYKKLGASLDIAYVAASHFYYPIKGSRGLASSNNLNENGTLFTTRNYIKKANFFEISPTISYEVAPHITMTAYFGYLIGNPSLGRFRYLITYVF